MKREIPKKNYFIVLAIGAVTIAVVLYVATLYKNTKFNDEKSVISDYLFNINVEELDNYLLENPDVVIYWANSEDLENAKFEKKLKKLIIKKDLQKQFIFLEVKGIEDKTILDVEKKYLTKNASLNNYPLILIVKDGKINEVIKSSQNIDIDYLEEKFMNHGVIE